MSERLTDERPVAFPPLGEEQVAALERIVDSILGNSPSDHIGYTIAEATKRLITDVRTEREVTKPILDVLSELSQRRQASAGLHDWDLAQSRGKFADHIERMLDVYDALNPKEESE